MSQRNEVSCSLDGHDACDAGDRENVAFLKGVFLDRGEEVGGGEADGADGDGDAAGRGFVGDGDLMDGGGGGEVGEM